MNTPATTSRPELYETITSQAEALLQGETDLIANAANLSSLLFYTLPDINWVGFYFLKAGQLVVGPFQGKVACVRIHVGRGVCGRAAERLETVIVEDVSKFSGHIPCDAASQSELVVPLIANGELLGVLDIDSPTIGRFDDADKAGLENVAAIFVNGSKPVC